MESKRLDFQGLAQAALSRARDLLPKWLPEGKIVGHEFIVGSFSGEAGSSLSFNLNTGRWGEFNGSERGGDITSFYAAWQGLEQGEAFRQLAEEIGFIDHDTTARSAPAPRPASNIGLPPRDAPPPTFNHRVHGPASKHWAYKARNGDLMGYISRHDPPEGGKQIVPHTWDSEKERWQQRGFDKPRPLYGLELLSHADKNDDPKPILLVEGEKAADAARAFLGHLYVVMTWCGGTGGIKAVDWSPLKERDVLIWPDHDLKSNKSLQSGEWELLPAKDQPGIKAATWIGRELFGLGAKVRIINVGVSPALHSSGFDAADAVAQGWDYKRWAEWAKPLIAPVTMSNAIDLGERKEAKADEEAERKLPGRVYALIEELGIAVSGAGTPTCNMENVCRALERWDVLKGKIWFDKFHNKIFQSLSGGKPEAWQDIDTIHLVRKLQRDLWMSSLKVHITFEAVQHVAHMAARDEVLDYINSLKWDGIERVEHFLEDNFGADGSAYTRAASKNFWVGLVARQYRPGVKLDNLLVLEGSQGQMKSYACEEIGGDWTTSMGSNVTSKDFFISMEGKMVIEIPDMDSFSRADINRIKAVITTRIDRYRSPYGRIAEDHPRRSVFIATTNDHEWLRDTEGRRFWPVRVKFITRQNIRDSRDQLFAEARDLFKAGAKWWEMPEDETKAVQEDRREKDAWEDIIAAYVYSKSSVTVQEVALEAVRLETGRLGRMEQIRITQALRLIGWTRGRIDGPGGRQVRGWKAPAQDEEAF